jgi:hypothetical protein
MGLFKTILGHSFDLLDGTGKSQVKVGLIYNALSIKMPFVVPSTDSST